jgi:hypothetical protein
MHGYVEQGLAKFEHSIPKQHRYGPSRAVEPVYGQRVQYTKFDESELASATMVKFIQRVTGKILYYARAIDNTMLHALNDIASSKNTNQTIAATRYFLNYADSNPNGSIIYPASDMIIQADSDAAYLVCAKARSRAGGYIFLGNLNKTQFNGPVLVLAKIIKNVMGSAAEAEVGALYIVAQEIVPMRMTLEELGHPQPATLTTDNSTACGIMNGTVKQKRTKAMDMRYYWLRDRVRQKQFNVFWEPGCNNLPDYPTKHHSGGHHRKVRDTYLYDKEKSPSTIQGCIKIMNSDKQSKPNTTGSANLAKARPAWKRTRTGRRVTWRDQQDITPQFKLKKVWTVRKDRMNNIRRGAICVSKGNRSLFMNNSFLTQ